MDEQKPSSYTIYCKRFYENHKDELREKIKPYQAVYRQKNREALRERARADYQKKKAKAAPPVPMEVSPA